MKKKLIALKGTETPEANKPVVTRSKAYPIHIDSQGSYILDDQNNEFLVCDHDWSDFYLLEHDVPTELVIQGLSNGVSIFEKEGKSMMGNVVKKNVTDEVVQALICFMKSIDVEAVRTEMWGSGYFLRLEKDEDE